MATTFPIRHPPSSYGNRLPHTAPTVRIWQVGQQKLLPTIRSILKLYTTIGIPKLAALREEADEATFREHLQCLKHKSHALVWTGGAPLSGEWASSADVDFYVDDDMAHVADDHLTRRHSAYFVKQIHKLEEIISALQR